MGAGLGLVEAGLGVVIMGILVLTEVIHMVRNGLRVVWMGFKRANRWLYCKPLNLQ